MNTPHPDPGTSRITSGHDDSAGNQAGRQIPRQPEDTTAGGDATNDTGEDNQRQKGGTPADEYIRR